MTTISAALTSVKALKELLQAATSLKIDNDTLVRINDALKEVSEIQDKLFEAREQLFNLQKGNDELRQQIKGHDDWKVRFDGFVLSNTLGGAVVYESRSDNPKHYACPQCIEKKQIQILQDLGGISGVFECPACKTKYQVKERQKITIEGRRPKSQFF